MSDFPERLPLQYQLIFIRELLQQYQRDSKDPVSSQVNILPDYQMFVLVIQESEVAPAQPRGTWVVWRGSGDDMKDFGRAIIPGLNVHDLVHISELPVY